MGKITDKQLRADIKRLKAKNKRELERKELVTIRRKLKFRKVIRTGKAIGRGAKAFGKGIDRGSKILREASKKQRKKQRRLLRISDFPA